MKWDTRTLTSELVGDNLMIQGQHRNGDSGRRHILCSISVHSFGALAKAVRLFIASPRNQLMCSQICFFDIFVDLAEI